MKKWIIALMVSATTLGASAAQLEYWEMDDPAGTALNALLNTGTLGSQWNWGGSGMATDGSGLFVLAGDGGTTTRKLPKKGTANAQPSKDAYENPLGGTETYSLEINFDSWDMAAATTGDELNLKAYSPDGTMLAAIYFQKDVDSSVRIRMASANSGYRNFVFGLTETNAHSARIDFNLTSGTAEYFIDGESQNTFSGLTFAGDIENLTLIKKGAWTTPGSSVSIESMGLSDTGVVDGIYLVGKFTDTLSNVPETNNIVTFHAQEGDVVVVMGASNKGSSPSTNTVVFGGTASLDPAIFEHVPAGSAVSSWRTTVQAGGVVTVDRYQSGTAFWTIGVYLLRAGSGSIAVADIVQDVGNPRGSVTNLYGFGGLTSGIYIEACSTYNKSGAVAQASGTIVDKSNAGGNRTVAHGEFTDVAGLTNIWTTLPGDSASGLLGLAFRSVSGDPESLYNVWISGYPVGAATNMADDADGDALDNLGEYAFGGDPSNPNDRGNVPVSEQAAGYLQYVYFERTDAVDRGLASSLEVGTDLVNTNWTVSGIEFVGSGAGPTGFNAQTNRIPTDVEGKQYLRLQVELAP
jgi:hypothetical protein